jgi:hypothetical protein
MCAPPVALISHRSRKQESAPNSCKTRNCSLRSADCCHSGTLLDFQLLMSAEAGSGKQENVLHKPRSLRPADCCHSGTLLDFQNVELPEGDGRQARSYSRESIGRAMEVGISTEAGDRGIGPADTCDLQHWARHGDRKQHRGRGCSWLGADHRTTASQQHFELDAREQLDVDWVAARQPSI